MKLRSISRQVQSTKNSPSFPHQKLISSLSMSDLERSSFTVEGGIHEMDNTICSRKRSETKCNPGVLMKRAAMPGDDSV